MLVDDGNAAVSLPEVPLLAVLPGTGGLTRLVDKRKVRRDLADVFCTLEEGIRGQRAVDWRLVDETVARTSFDARIHEKALQMAESSDRPGAASGVSLTPIERDISDDSITYPYVKAQLDRAGRVATIVLESPANNPPSDITGIEDAGVDFWPLALVRSLDDLMLHLRFNEPELGTLVFKTEGDVDVVCTYDQLLRDNKDHWLVREILLYWKRTLKRIDYTSRSTFAMIEPGSCFAGLLAEILFSVDRSYMLEGQFEDDERPPATIQLTESNFGFFPMGNGLTRLETRFLGEPDSLSSAKSLIGTKLEAGAALDAGLITFAPDDIDWEDEIRLLLEERASFSPDSLTGMEANLRFAGPETMETRIFGRLTAWQNWIFQRPNAVGESGALKSYGTGKRPAYDRKRV